MKTRTFLAVATGMLMLGGAAVAQTRPAAGSTDRSNARPGTPQRFLQRHPMRRLLAQLNLSEAQKERIRSLFEAAQSRVQAIRQDASLTPEQKRARVQPIMKSLHESILGALTPDQKEKLAQMRRTAVRNAVRDRVRDNVRDNARDNARDRVRDRFMGILQRLDLTEAQKTDIRKIVQTQREKARIIRESSMADADKRARMKDLAQETRQGILNVLTPDQRARLEAMRPGPNGKAGPRPGQ